LLMITSGQITGKLWQGTGFLPSENGFDY